MHIGLAKRAVTLALATLALALAPAGEISSAPAQASVSYPGSVTSGVVSAVTLRLPANVAAVEGRILLDRSSAELIGLAPDSGVALAPVAIDAGYAFGAYGMTPRNGRIALRLVILPKVSGIIDVRVVLDALASVRGLRIDVGPRRLTGSLRVDGGNVRRVAPRGSPRLDPTLAAGTVRPVLGRPAISVDDLDAVRPAWYLAREQNRPCAPSAGASGDANGDGCVDVVDLQAVLWAGGDTRATLRGSDGAGLTAAVARPSGSARATTSALSPPAPARTFTVTSAADTPDQSPGNGTCADASGACTLRAALTESNWQRGQTLINFNLPGTAPVTIQLSGSLPNVGTSLSSVYIDGYSQPGSRVNDATYGTNAIPGVEVRGLGNGVSSSLLYVPRAGNVIRGLLLGNASRGIFLDGAGSTGNAVVGNWIGFNRDGSLPARGAVGVLINNGARDNTVGTAAPADRNVIGNWDKAVFVNGAGSDRATIQNNVLCMRPDGGAAICQTGIDFDFGPKNALVGGGAPGEGNVIGPTCCNAVELSHGWNPSGGGSGPTWEISGNRVVGNWLGFRIDGSYDADFRSAQSVPTYDNGQAVNIYDGALDNIVEGNYIASVYDGVTVASSTTRGNIVRDNIIGTSPLGEPAPMAGWGIYMRWGTLANSVIANRISNAAAGGVGLIEADVRQVTISRNLVDATGGPAIFFAADPNVPTTGANELLAGPALSATTDQVSGTGVPGATVEVFRASRPAGAVGLPTEYLGSAVVNGAGAWSLAVALAQGDVVTALQTRGDGTSSLLATNAQVSSPPSPPTADFTWTQTGGTLTVAFSDSSSNSPTAWLWDFGDGSSSTLQDPSRSYAAAGDYTVSLTASNGGGSSTAIQTVHVDPLPAGAPIAADSFGRGVTSGWGTADAGGLYSLFGTAANYSVAGGVGQMTLPKPGNTRMATLAVSATDVDLLVRISTDKPPAGGAQYAYLLARNGGGNSYRPKIIIYPNGSVAVHAGITISNSESSLGPAVTVPGLSYVPGGAIWLRAQVVGTNPTTIRVRAWADGQPEPTGWQFSAINAAAVLQGPGGVGLSAYVAGSTTNTPVSFWFDDFAVVGP